MNYLTPELRREIRKALLDCDLFSSHQQLNAIFIDPRIKAWQNRLPIQNQNIQDLVNSVIELLADKQSTGSQENALVLFLEVLADEVDPGDICHQQLEILAEKLRQAHTQSFELLRPSPSISQSPAELRLVLMQILAERFNISELKTLCFNMQIDPESLGHAAKPDMARELILHLDRRNRLGELLPAIRKLRPDIFIMHAMPSINSPVLLESEKRVVEAKAGDLFISLQEEGQKWILSAANQGNWPLRQVNIVFRPAPTVVVTPNRLELHSVAVGETVQEKNPIVIRPNSSALEDVCHLNFAVIYMTPKGRAEHSSEFLLPI